MLKRVQFSPQAAKNFAYAIVFLAAGAVVWIFYHAYLLLAFLAGVPTVSHGFASLFGFLIAISSEWYIATGTVLLSYSTWLLYRATRSLARSTAYSIASDGPFIAAHVFPTSLFPADPDLSAIFANVKPAPYLLEYLKDDAADVNRNMIREAFSNGKTPEYLNIFILNRASKPLGVAVNVKVSFTLYFGAANHAAPNHPFNYKRSVNFSIIETGASVSSKICDVTGMTGYLLTVDRIEYSDLTGRKREAGTSLGIISKTSTGLDTSVKVFSPRKGEFTDAV